MVTWWNPISFSPGSLHFRSVSTSGGGGTAYFPQITKQTFLPINSSCAPHLNICQEIRASSVKLNSTVLLFKPCISSSVLSQYVTHSSAQIIRNYCWLLPAMTFFFPPVTVNFYPCFPNSSMKIVQIMSFIWNNPPCEIRSNIQVSGHTFGLLSGYSYKYFWVLLTTSTLCCWTFTFY